jgi:hypothetical protein
MGAQRMGVMRCGVSGSSFKKVLDGAVPDVVGPGAASTDGSGVSARAAVAALGELRADVVGRGDRGRPRLDGVAQVGWRLAGSCESAAMIVVTHPSAVRVIEANGSDGVRRAIASGS